MVYLPWCMASASFSINFELRATCTRCGIERDIPEGDRPMPAYEGDVVTVFADSRCGCGSRRINLEARFDVEED